jgi:SAM-dependent methyltransferase
MTSAAHPGPVLEKAGAHQVVDCAACGYAHILPMPTPADLKRLYGEKFYGEDKTQYFVRMEQDIEWWNMVYAERYETIERLLGPRPGRRILDVGCSGGWFMSSGRARGWKTLGIELGRQAVEYARRHGLDVLEEDANDADLLKLGPFDAIHSSFVFEHLPEPAALLRKLVGALAPGGILVTDVPNDFNPLQLAARKSLQSIPYWVAPDHHLNYFTPDSLRRLFAENGLEAVEMEGTFPLEMFLLMGDNYIGNDAVGRPLHGKRKRFELALEKCGLRDLKRDLYRFLISKQIGREIILYGRKS